MSTRESPPPATGRVFYGWFVARRGLAMGAALAGGAAGGLLLVPLAGFVIAALGWPAAYQALAAVALGGMLPLVWFLLADTPGRKGLAPLGERDHSEQTDEGSDDARPETSGCTLREALSRSTFWWLGLAFCLGSAAAFGVTTHQVAFLQDAGLGLEWASAIAGLTLGVTTAGRLLVGWASGRTDRPHRMLGACLVMQAVGVALLLETDAWGLWAVAAFALLFGLGFGGFVVLYPLCVGHDFGLRAFGAIAGCSARSGSRSEARWGRSPSASPTTTPGATSGPSSSARVSSSQRPPSPSRRARPSARGSRFAPAPVRSYHFAIIPAIIGS